MKETCRVHPKQDSVHPIPDAAGLPRKTCKSLQLSKQVKAILPSTLTLSVSSYRSCIVFYAVRVNTYVTKVQYHYIVRFGFLVMKREEYIYCRVVVITKVTYK